MKQVHDWMPLESKSSTTQPSVTTWEGKALPGTPDILLEFWEHSPLPSLLWASQLGPAKPKLTDLGPGYRLRGIPRTLKANTLHTHHRLLHSQQGSGQRTRAQAHGGIPIDACAWQWTHKVSWLSLDLSLVTNVNQVSGISIHKLSKKTSACLYYSLIQQIHFWGTAFMKWLKHKGNSLVAMVWMSLRIHASTSNVIVLRAGPFSSSDYKSWRWSPNCGISDLAKGLEGASLSVLSLPPRESSDFVSSVPRVPSWKQRVVCSRQRTGWPLELWEISFYCLWVPWSMEHSCFLIMMFQPTAGQTYNGGPRSF